MKAAKVLLRGRPGRFSSMLDMGGVSAGDTKASKLNTGKNNKVRAIALDFDLITRSIDQKKMEDNENDNDNRNRGEAMATGAAAKSNTKKNVLGDVKPHVGAIENIANLLNVNLGGEKRRNTNNPIDDSEDDDLSLLLGKTKNDTKKSNHAPEPASEREVNNESPNIDIRTRYAAKLRNRVEGGLSGVELANSKREEALKQGDAEGHFAARKLAAANTVAKAGSKWMASTGSGTLLQFLDARSMIIALIPTPKILNAEEKGMNKKAMNELTKQLSNLKFDILSEGVDSGSDSDVGTRILTEVANEIEAGPKSTLVVSDKDEYLRSGRDLGMFTCRVRRKNQPRGNITTNFNVEDVADVQDVINELNGISFNTVFSSS